MVEFLLMNLLQPCINVESLDSEEIKEMINQIDMNNNGLIDYTEFLASTLKSKIYLSRGKFEKSFFFL